MKYKKLSIIIPVFNEQDTLMTLLKKVKVLSLPIEKEVIIVDDGSTDDSQDILKKFIKGKKNNFKIIFNQKNRGKGRAIRTALKLVSGDLVVIQDADLEYDPQDLKKMLTIMDSKRLKVLYGSRHLHKKRKRHAEYYFYWGGLILNWLTNFLYGTKLTDEATCYKMIDTKLLQSLKLKCERFEFCPEVTAKLARQGIKITETAISYRPRLKKDGKKIQLKDGLEAVATLFKYWQVRW